MATASNNNGGDGSDPRHTTFRLNPEALRGVPELPDLDRVKVIYVQQAPTWMRWTEGLVIHIIGTGLVATIAFGAGLLIGGNLGG